MPDREVENIRDLIFYQYAKIIARSAFSVKNGKEAKQQHYGFIKKTFRELKAGDKSWSQITREDWQFVESEKKCIYCGTTQDLQREHIIPKSLRIKLECATCDRVQGIHNQVWACQSCNSAKGDLGLYEFLQKLHMGEPKFYDLIPPLVEKKYLKTIANCHECAGTLESRDLDGDGEITVLDIDQILHKSAKPPLPTNSAGTFQ
ncbi:MAG: HNH endonuclease [Verrucomicrobiota bacterium]|jgi:5-methylcytosine-specific restriction endonuclease McrA